MTQSQPLSLPLYNFPIVIQLLSFTFPILSALFSSIPRPKTSPTYTLTFTLSDEGIITSWNFTPHPNSRLIIQILYCHIIPYAQTWDKRKAYKKAIIC